MAALYCALVHHPVRDREGNTVTTAVTTLDVHDIARSCCTYGASGYFVVTPVAAQRTLVERILGHWESGAGKTRMPERARALAAVEVASSLADVTAKIEAREGAAPVVVATAAHAIGLPVWSFSQLRSALHDPAPPHLIVLGTGHGLADEVLQAAAGLLEPISGPTDYNHLSVRAAAAIMLDRLFGR